MNVNPSKRNGGSIMKRFLVFAVALICLVSFASLAVAEDKIINLKIQSVTTAMTKTGSPYVRVIVGEKRTLQGISYEAGIPAMCFGPVADAAKTLKAGDMLKAVVSERDFNGRSSYTVLSILK